MTEPAPAVVCPSCASGEVAAFGGLEEEEEGDVLSADVGPARPPARNMRCLACGHTWWQTPAAGRPGAEGAT